MSPVGYSGCITQSATTSVDDFTLCTVRLQLPNTRTPQYWAIWNPLKLHKTYISPLHFILLLCLSLPLDLALWTHLIYIYIFFLRIEDAHLIPP